MLHEGQHALLPWHRACSLDSNLSCACRLWLVASSAALLGLVIDLVGWLGPHLLRAIKETAYSIQFCLVLGLDIDTGCVTVCVLLSIPMHLTGMFPLLPYLYAEGSVLLQVEYQHSPGGVADLYLFPDQSSQRQGTLLQRQAYIGQYQVRLCFLLHLQSSLTPSSTCDEVVAFMCR